MEHIMKLYESSFNDLKSGKKKREYRLNDDKRKLVRIVNVNQFLDKNVNLGIGQFCPIPY